MFDWNDEELTDILWDEAGENDDHIVPYPEQVEEKAPNLFGESNKKETNQETANVCPVEQKKPCIKSEHELDSNSDHDRAIDPWPDGLDSSLSDAGKAEPDSIRTAESKNLTKAIKNESSRDDNIQSDKGSELFQNPPEDREQGDFVDYGWANIGSFDDLDRIFSNNDPLFGDMSVGNSDELWSSSKDVTGSPMGPTPLHGDSSDLALGPLRTSSDRSEIKAQYSMIDDPSHSFISGYEKSKEIRSHAPEDVQASIDTIEHSGGKSKLLMKEKSFEMGGKIRQIDDEAAATVNELPDKSNRQKTLLKGKKLDNKSERRQLQGLCGSAWFSSGAPFQQVNSQYVPSVPPLQQNHLSGPFLASPMYGNVVNYHHAVPPVLVNANPIKKSVNAAVASLKPPVMTPKEKIEKLRRRQQMRALLAIQKQQQQFGNQVASVAEHSAMEGGSVDVDENLSSFPSFEQNSPVDHDDSNNASSMAFDNCSMEESVLYRLQDVIAKLELRIRLCIRDSLFRLAQSAMQRQYPSDTSSTNTNSREEVMGNKDIDNHERFTRIPEAETDTNPIDRTVAHLLFHRPMDFSGKPAEMPDSPLSANFPYGMKANSLKSLAKGFFPDSFENTQMISPQGSKTAALFSEGDQSNSENVANNEAAEGAVKKAEASK